jgi:hypothetical protein
VNRALDKLRDLFEKRGIKTTAAALSAALLAEATQAAPSGAVARIMSSLCEDALTHTSFVAPSSWMRKGVFIGGALLVAVVIFFLSEGSRFAAAPKAATLQSEIPITAATAKAQTASEPLQTTQQEGEQKTLNLTVVDAASGAPLKQVEVKWSTFTDVLKSKSETLVTGDDGSVALTFPLKHERDFHHRAHLARDGYVPRHVSWSVFQHDQIGDIPATYTAKMDRGIEIGGVVRDINNQPISDVKLVFTGPSPVGVPPRERDTVMGNYHTEITDENGQWRCNHVRSEFASTTFSLEHPLFRPVIYGCKETTQPSIGPIRLPAADFLARRAEMKLERGFIVSGTVLDEGGKPIPGAIVAKDRIWTPKEKTKITGAKGEFSFHDATPGEVIITAQAEGFAPRTIKSELVGAEAKLTFGLQPSRGLIARLVDTMGNPVAGAEITPDQDQQYRKLYRWTVRTASDGTFAWNSCPNEPFELAVFAYGFGHTNITIEPGNAVRTIVLGSKRENQRHTVIIRAIDIETRKPVEHARLHIDQGGAGVSPLQGTREGNLGVFTFVSTDPEAQYIFEARARGYRPARSQLVKPIETQEIELALEKGEEINATVLGPDGSPAVGAAVALCTEEKGANLSTERRLLFTDESAVVYTDQNGKFEHELLSGAHSFYVVHQSGFAAVRLSKWQNGTPIQLQQWGRIEGIAKFNGQIAGDIELGLLAPNPNGNERWLNLYSFNTRTDADGRFTFENVPPIEAKLSWMRPVARGKHFSHSMNIDVQPGVTTQVIYAPEGPTVRGRLRLEGDSGVDWTTQARFTSFGVKMEAPSYEQFRDNPEAMKKAYTDFWLSDEGRAWSRKQQSYSLELRQDGTFEVPAVPPGEYLLRVHLHEKTERQFPPGKRIGFLEKTIIVPADSSSFDLGEILVTKR